MGEMKITILSIGSEGDVRYLLALGKALLAEGHSVNFATHRFFEKRVRSLGFEFSLIRVNPGEFLNSDAGQIAVKQGKVLDFIRTLKPVILEAGIDSWAACQGTEALIYSPVAWYFGADIGDKLGVPNIAAWAQPVDPTSAFPSWLVTQKHLGGTLNRLTYYITHALSWWPVQTAVNQWRREQLNLPPHGLNWHHAYHQRPNPVLCAFSPQVVPKPRDWGDHIAITGYWFLDEGPDWQPPAYLADFLAAGAPPVYIGFGSMSNRSPQEMTNLALKALELAHMRGILASGWGGISKEVLPQTVINIDYAPHDWLFPRMAAAVHHGGAGTTGAALRAGIPCIIIPHMMDQPFWGQRVADLGVGPQPIPRNKLTLDRLAVAISQAVNDHQIRQRAVALGECIRAEDGIGQAVKVISRNLAR
jgi:sterol 3beta-glucosyltransferase